jgi:hypothetical protein
MTNNKINRYKTSDMKIHKDSQGCYSVDHGFQGTLIDGHYFSSRTECRRAAALLLKGIKEGITTTLSTEETSEMESIARRAKIFWE